ncbi:MAG: reverse transcriptase domain-containing protein [Lachnospiraceae bacterium]|nr:reverse transcriptase domain-containing protein [Lachnospiraceae bacterium]
MKSYNHLMEKAIAYDNLDKAIMNSSKGKRDRRDVKEILDHKDYYIPKIQRMLIYRTWGPRTHVKKVINEGSRSKTREIIQPDYQYEQIIHHAVMQVLIPILQKGMYEYSCGSIPKKGPHYAKRYIQKALKDTKNTRYVAELDIKKFFQSVKTRYLKRRLSKIIHDEDFLWIVYMIIESGEDELPIGFYTSQWFANWILTPLDHYIKQVLKVKTYVRYIDNMYLFGASKKQLHKNVQSIKDYLATMELKIKENWQVYKIEYEKTVKGETKVIGRAVDFIGFVFHRNRITIRRSIYYSIMRTARRIGKKDKPSVYDCRKMLSYMGWITHTDTYNSFLTYVKPNVDIKRMKNYVSKKDKMQNVAA